MVTLNVNETNSVCVDFDVLKNYLSHELKAIFKVIPTNLGPDNMHERKLLTKN